MSDWMARDLHSALKVDRIGEAVGGGVRFLLVWLQYGKADIAYGLHANPQMFEMGLVQPANYLENLGFQVSDCAFLGSRCLVTEIKETFDTAAFAASFERGWAAYRDAGNHLAPCGLVKRSGEIEYEAYGDGHTAAQTNKLKESSDDIFSYVLTWIDTGNEKGWAFHYRPKHPPVSPEVGAALALIGGFNQFPECPQFDFEQCYWRFVRKRDQDRRSIWDEQLGYVHTQFDAHSTRFSPGLQPSPDGSRRDDTVRNVANQDLPTQSGDGTGVGGRKAHRA
jgi:hypothetical protein